MKRSSLFFAVGAVAAVGFAAFATQAAGTPLLTATKATPAGLTADASYRALAADRATVSLQLVQADASQIDAKTDRIQLGLGDAGTAYLRSVTQNADGTVVWSGTLGRDFGPLARMKSALDGEIADDPKNSVIIVRNGDKLTGTIRSNGELYSLRPLRSGGHALVRVDEAKMPADHPEADYKRLFEQATSARLRSLRDTDAVEAAPGIAKANAIIRVLVAYTPSARSAVGDITGLINLAVAETNQGYSNSGVAITLQLASTVAVTYTESGSFSTDLSRFRGTTDGYMDSIHTTRNSTAADVGVLIINNSSSCGLASGIGSSASTAFAAVHYSCATGYYSFGHEIGHLQSARHDPATDPSTSPYAYGHGYRSPTSAWRTIMAYACSNNCARINYWSNPAKTYNSQAMGTTATSHNQRVLNNTAATVSAFR
ncbi:M12 family metallo-peptidase [Lysobacter hankyongensis]|uniref:Zinc-dependent metalloprotease n=1 Tax=Lysobacter hankyongensis TaxID=1176535 RepID=A0ABP9BL87_9GAMM